MKYCFFIVFILSSFCFLGWSLVPSKQEKSIGEILVDGIQEVTEDVSLLPNLSISKITIRKLVGHFFFCFTIALLGSIFLSCNFQNHIQILRFMIIYSFCLAILGEVLQFFAKGRFPSLADVAINLSGALLASFFYYAMKNNLSKEII